MNAATINGAFAMGLGNFLGTITKGKTANLIITSEVPSLEFLPYCFGSNLIDKVIIGVDSSPKLIESATHCVQLRDYPEFPES